MPYVPPRYAPRDDWRQMIVNSRGNINVNSWVVDIITYWTWRMAHGAQGIDDGWQRLRMPQDHAKKAFSTQPPRPDNDVGLVPPEIAGRVFARSLAKSVDPATHALIHLDPPIPATMVTETPSFTPPRYAPRADWQARLEAIDPAAGTWQADLARYWSLRRAGQSEPDAWRTVAMSPANARLALVSAPVTASNNSGLIPCIVDGPDRDTVARRVLARSVAARIDDDDIYNGLVLEAAEEGDLSSEEARTAKSSELGQLAKLKQLIDREQIVVDRRLIYRWKMGDGLHGNHDFDADLEDPPALVNVSAFAPGIAARSEETLIQIFLHQPDQSATVAERAKEADHEAQRRGVATLTANVAIGQCLDMVLVAPGASIELPSQRVIWRGEPEACQFVLKAPADPGTTAILCRVTVLADGAPIGSLRFRLPIADRPDNESSSRKMVGDGSRHYDYAFLSYASPDRAKVLERAQVLKAMRVEFFHDLLKLEPGQRWEKRLYEEIDRCDVFLLFWSRHASESKWVLAEVDRAIARHGGNDEAPPDIVPIVLEGPPMPSVPDSLKDIQMNDWLRYVIAAEEATRRS